MNTPLSTKMIRALVEFSVFIFSSMSKHLHFPFPLRVNTA